MENVTIEKMEVKRFYALLIRTIVGVLLMAMAIWGAFCLDNDIPSRFMGKWFVFLNILNMIIVWRTSSILETIKKSRKLAGALDSEIYSVYNYKALSTGFYAAIISGLFLSFFGGLFNFSIRVGCLLVVAISFFSVEIRRLILYKP